MVHIVNDMFIILNGWIIFIKNSVLRFLLISVKMYSIYCSQLVRIIMTEQYFLNILFVFWPVVEVNRDGASTNSTLLIRDGNASLTMKTLKVSDEGTYICTITSGPFQTQQIVQLNILRECLASMWTSNVKHAQISLLLRLLI